MKKRLFIMMVLVALTGLLLPACSSKSDSSSDQKQATTEQTTKQQTPASTPVEKVIMAQPSDSLNNLPIYVGMAKGIFQSQGLDVEEIVMKSNVQISGLLSGDLHFSGSSGSAIRATMTGQAPLKVFIHITAKPMSYLVTRPQFKTVASLKGKVLGVSQIGSTEDYALRESLKANGLSPNEVSIQSIGASSERFAALLAGSIDGTVLTPPSNFKAEKEGMNILSYTGDYVEMPQNGMATTEKIYNTRPELVKKMAKGIIESIKYTKEHKDESIKIIAEKFKLDPATAERAYNDQIKAITDTGMVDEAVIKVELELAAEEQKLELKNYKISDYVDYTLLKQVLGK